MARTLKRRWVWVGLTLMAGPALTAGRASAQTPPSSDADCVRCHGTAAASWAPSAHAQAWTDPLVEAERGADTTGWCGSCHRPSGVSSGIGCVDCHLEAGRVLSARAPTAAGRAAHPMREADWDGVSECAGCHEFRFPDASQTRSLRFDPAGWLQQTVQEWRRIPAEDAGGTCVSCHMPGGGHGMRTTRDLASVVDVAVRARSARGGARVRLTLTARGVGHDFPTGDMYRAIEVRVWEPGAEDRAAVTRLTRHFARGADRLRREVLDTRLSPGRPRRIVLTLPGAPAEVAWSVSLLRVPPERAAAMRVDVPPRVIRRGTVSVE